MGNLQSVNVTIAALFVLTRFDRNKVVHTLQRAVCLAVVLKAYNIWCADGKTGLLREFVKLLRLFPGVNAVVNKVLAGEVAGAVQELTDGDGAVKEQRIVPIPEKGIPREDILREMMKDKAGDGRFTEEGKAFALVYFNSEGEFGDHSKMISQIYGDFAHDSGLPMPNKAQETLCNEVGAFYP